MIFGARSIDQVRDNLAAAELSLEPKHVQTLEEASQFELGYPYDFVKNVQGRW